MRRIARSDHCRWVSRPRCARASANVTSSCQRRHEPLHHLPWRDGQVSAEQRLRLEARRRIAARTQRSGTTGIPAWYQTAVPLAGLDQASLTPIPADRDHGPSRGRVDQPLGQGGLTLPFLRGAPRVPAAAAVTRSYNAASNRQPGHDRHRLGQAARRPPADRSPHMCCRRPRRRRSGSQRRNCFISWRAQSDSVLCRRLRCAW